MTFCKKVSALFLSPFFCYRIVIAGSSLLCLSGMSFIGSYPGAKSAAVYTFYSMVLTFGFCNHLRRSGDFSKKYRLLLFFVLALFGFLFCGAKYFDSLLRSYELSYVLIPLAVSHALSLFMFDALVRVKEKVFWMLLDSLLLLVTISIICLSVIDYGYYKYGALAFLFRIWVFVLLMSRVNPGGATITKAELALSYISGLVAVFPMIYVTSVFLEEASSGASMFPLFVLKLSSILSILLISMFNNVKSNAGSGEGFLVEYKLIVDVLAATYVVAISVLVVCIEMFERRGLYISFLPLVTLSGIWAKQNLQFDFGSGVIFRFNVLLSLSLVVLSAVFLSEAVVFLVFVLFYTVLINIYYCKKSC